MTLIDHKRITFEEFLEMVKGRRILNIEPGNDGPSEIAVFLEHPGGFGADDAIFISSAPDVSYDSVVTFHVAEEPEPEWKIDQRVWSRQYKLNGKIIAFTSQGMPVVEFDNGTVRSLQSSAVQEEKDDE